MTEISENTDSGKGVTFVERSELMQLACVFGAALSALLLCLILDLFGLAKDDTFLVVMVSMALLRTFRWKVQS